MRSESSIPEESSAGKKLFRLLTTRPPVQDFKCTQRKSQNFQLRRSSLLRLIALRFKGGAPSLPCAHVLRSKSNAHSRNVGTCGFIVWSNGSLCSESRRESSGEGAQGRQRYKKVIFALFFIWIIANLNMSFPARSLNEFECSSPL